MSLETCALDACPRAGGRRRGRNNTPSLIGSTVSGPVNKLTEAADLVTLAVIQYGIRLQPDQ